MHSDVPSSVCELLQPQPRPVCARNACLSSLLMLHSRSTLSSYIGLPGALQFPSSMVVGHTSARFFDKFKSVDGVQHSLTHIFVWSSSAPCFQAQARCVHILCRDQITTHRSGSLGRSVPKVQSVSVACVVHHEFWHWRRLRTTLCTDSVPPRVPSALAVSARVVVLVIPGLFLSARPSESFNVAHENGAYVLDTKSSQNPSEQHVQPPISNGKLEGALRESAPWRPRTTNRLFPPDVS